MAAIFYAAIHKAISANKIVTAPALTTVPQTATCDKFAGTGHDAGGKTQRGSGADDGIYKHDSSEMGASTNSTTAIEIKLTRIR